MRQRESDHRHEGRGPQCDGRVAANGLHTLDALRLQRLAGNRALAGVISGARRADGARTAPISALVQRAAPTDTAPAPAAATDEQALVRQWSAETGAKENTLTDRLYFHRHPERQGVALEPGTPGAAEWIGIRETVVRPALATASPPAQEPAEPAPGAPGESAQVGDGAGAGDLLRDAAQAGVDLIDWAVETGGAMVDAVAGFLGVDREVIDAGEVQQPAVVVDVPLESAAPPEEPAAPAHQRGDAFKNQRDNKSAHVAGGASCSPTSFTMALVDLHGGDEEAVRGRTIELLKERGGNTDYTQTEELIIELLQVVDWPKATAEKPAYFWNPKTWAEWAKNHYDGRYYKDPNAQQYVASLYSATSGKAAETYNALTREQWAPVIKALADGAVATAEGAFTEDGHVVNIVDADDSGVTINDPYGVWLKGYGYQIMNGEPTVPKLGATDRQTLERRATTNPELIQVYERFHSTSPPQDAGFAAWGQRNFYSWDDVAKVKLGTWVSVLRRQ